MIPDEIIYTYVAFLNNYDKVAAALEKYYTEPMGHSRAKLLQEIARPQKGCLSERVMKANVVLDKILDHYNTMQKIEHEDVEIDIDMDGEVEKLVFRGGMGVIMNSKKLGIKRVK